MDFNLIWKTVLILVVGLILLRIGGRRSISQMTAPHTIIMIMLGTLLIHPVKSKGVLSTIGISFILILSLIIIELIELKFNGLESIIAGKAKIVIENGEINEKNLKKLRLTVDQLETHLRQLSITSISDIEYATMEVNGQLGYTLKKEKQAATKEDIQNLIQLIQTGQLSIQNEQSMDSEENIFTEITNKTNSSNKEMTK
ncbi:DUF421 domain-containing protein [Psychrobacillus sp. NPDC058041]|uniref:DUF421 domain-containing protein n=1 Tax=Psychrobacillus sp. NPDC058041 TaxID=3346310 RepID=UPI0036DE2CD9